MADKTKRIFGMITTSASAEYTALAISSFFTFTRFDKELDSFVLIDNDGTYSEAPPADVATIHNERPLGFAANMNKILVQAKSQRADAYLLNNDLVFTEGWDLPFTEDRTSILSPLSNRELQYNTDIMTTSVAMGLDNYAGKEAALNTLARVHREKNVGYYKAMIVPFFAVRIPYQVLDTVGELDENFGRGGGEDYDYCLRAYLANFEVKYALSSYILHFGGKSSWSGAESREVQLNRESHFKKVFSEKWGSQLLDLLLHDKDAVVHSNPELASAAKKGDHKTIITALRPS